MQISISVSEETKQKLEQLATQVKNGSMSSIAVLMIEHVIKQIESDKLGLIDLILKEKKT